MDEVTERLVKEREARRVLERWAEGLAVLLALSLAANVVLYTRLQDARRDLKAAPTSTR